MFVEVSLLRFQGRRLSDRDVANSRKYKGQLRSYGAKGSTRPAHVELTTSGGIVTPILGPLYDPSFWGVNFEAFMIGGIERLELPEGVFGVVQEWYCKPITSGDLTREHTG